MQRRTKPRVLPERLSVGGILEKVGRNLGIKVNLEPRWKIAGQVITKDGRKRYFKLTTLDLNTQGASRISSDKDYAAYFLKKMGYPVVEGEAFYSDVWCKEVGSDRNSKKALRYARTLGFPVIVKPNGASWGKGVFLVHNVKELRTALSYIFTFDKIALVQRRIVGRDYRIVVLDGDVISAYERVPLSVTGNGRSTIKELLAIKQDEFRKNRRDTKIDVSDPRIQAKLSHQGLNSKFRPRAGERVVLLENANLSSGGDAIDVTDSLHLAWKRLSAKIAYDMNLRLAGIDVMLTGTLSEAPSDYSLLEINDSPGLDHYASIGPKQKKVVEDLYRDVLKAMAR